MRAVTFNGGEAILFRPPEADIELVCKVVATPSDEWHYRTGRLGIVVWRSAVIFVDWGRSLTLTSYSSHYRSATSVQIISGCALRRPEEAFGLHFASRFEQRLLTLPLISCDMDADVILVESLVVAGVSTALYGKEWWLFVSVWSSLNPDMALRDVGSTVLYFRLFPPTVS